LSRLLLAAWVLCLAGCPGDDDDDTSDLPPLVLDDDDAVDDDDSATIPFVDCGAPDAAQAYFSPYTLELSELLEVFDARALGWAMDVASFRFAGRLSQTLELSVLSYVDGVCPARTLVTEPGPEDSRCAEVTRNTRALGSWEGGCVGGCSFEIVGRSEFELRRLQCSLSEGVLSEVEQSVRGESFEIGALERHLGGVSRFGFDGVVHQVARRIELPSGGRVVEEEWSVDTDFLALPGAPKGVLSDLFRQGSGFARFDGSARSTSEGVDAAVVVRSTAGVVYSAGISPPWQAEFDVAWDSSECALEPLRGTISARRFASKGGPEWGVSSIVYDGADRCDGCGEVYVGADSVGSFCRSLPPSSPAEPAD
jgi:hypothetical protein